MQIEEKIQIEEVGLDDDDDDDIKIENDEKIFIKIGEINTEMFELTRKQCKLSLLIKNI